MAAPGDDYINQALTELETVLKASPAFMASNAPSAPAGANGPVRYVEANLPATNKIPIQRLIHCGLAYVADTPIAKESTDHTTAMLIEIGLRFYHRGANRTAVWGKVQKATAMARKVVSEQMKQGGGRFAGFAYHAEYRGGRGVDVAEGDNFGAMLLARVNLKIQLPN